MDGRLQSNNNHSQRAELRAATLWIAPGFHLFRLGETVHGYKTAMVRGTPNYRYIDIIIDTHLHYCLLEGKLHCSATANPNPYSREGHLPIFLLRYSSAILTPCNFNVRCTHYDI